MVPNLKVTVTKAHMTNQKVCEITVKGKMNNTVINSFIFMFCCKTMGNLAH